MGDIYSLLGTVTINLGPNYMSFYDIYVQKKSGRIVVRVYLYIKCNAVGFFVAHTL